MNIIDTNAKDAQKQYGLMNGPQNIMFDITQKCNMNCLHCYNNSHVLYNSDLTDEEMLDVTYQILDLEPMVVCLCGGEPTLRFDLCVSIARILSGDGIVVNMVSNGSLLTIERLEKLFDAGVKSIQISLDSSSEGVVNRFRGVDFAYKSSVNAIKAILGLNRMPAVACIPTKLNYRQMPALGSFLKELGINELRWMPFIPIGRGYQNRESLELTLEQREELYWLLSEAEKNLEGFKFEYGDPLEHIYLFRNNTEALNPSIEIKSNGDIQLSSYLPYIYGNLRRNTLKELWNSGLSSIWRRDDFRKITREINTLEDIKHQLVLPYAGLDTDLFDTFLGG